MTEPAIDFTGIPTGTEMVRRMMTWPGLLTAEGREHLDAWAREVLAVDLLADADLDAFLNGGEAPSQTYEALGITSPSELVGELLFEGEGEFLTDVGRAIALDWAFKVAIAVFAAGEEFPESPDEL